MGALLEAEISTIMYTCIYSIWLYKSDQNLYIYISFSISHIFAKKSPIFPFSLNISPTPTNIQKQKITVLKKTSFQTQTYRFYWGSTPKNDISELVCNTMYHHFPAPKMQNNTRVVRNIHNSQL